MGDRVQFKGMLRRTLIKACKGMPPQVCAATPAPAAAEFCPAHVLHSCTHLRIMSPAVMENTLPSRCDAKYSNTCTKCRTRSLFCGVVWCAGRAVGRLAQQRGDSRRNAGAQAPTPCISTSTHSWLRRHVSRQQHRADSRL